MALNRNQRPGTASELRNALRDAGEAEFERATLPLQRPSAPEQTSLPPSLPPPEPTIKAPEPTSLSPDPPASKPAMKAPESVSKNSAPDPQSVPTMRVDSPPAVPSWERGGVSPTAAASFAGEADKERKPQKRVALIVAGVLVAAISIAVVAWSSWQPWGGGEQSSSSGPTQTDKQSGDTATTASSSAKPRAGTIVRNQIGMELVYVPPGSFMMGSNNGDSDEKPVHEVTIREGFYMGRYEVTQLEWQQVMGNSPSEFKGDNLPVEQVSWDDAQSFINKLNERRDGFKYRLPTEAEWEYACRAGTTTDFAFGNSLSSDQANFDRQKTTAVGSFAPNAFGLYDMHGNVWERCEDWHHETYAGAPTDGSAWLSGGEQKYRVLRGGSWLRLATYLRSANRGGNTPGNRLNLNRGFRIVAVVRTQ